MLKLIGVLFLYLICISCTDVYYDRHGEKIKIFNQASDQLYVSPEIIALNPFDLNSFLYPGNDSAVSVQYVMPSDIKDAAKKSELLFVILYYPNCPSAEAYVALAKAVEEKNIPVILLSIANYPYRMKNWYKQVGIKNKNLYIIPHSDSFDAKLLTKSIQFLAELCPPCFKSYKDELYRVNYVLFKDKGKEVKLSIDDYIYYPEDAMPWIEKNTGMSK